MKEYLKLLNKIQTKLEIVEDLSHSTLVELKKSKMAISDLEEVIEKLNQNASNVLFKLTWYIEIIEKGENLKSK